MPGLSFQKSALFDVTVVANTFIDRFMPAANGDFVKVYLFLLRQAAGGRTSLPVDEAADALMCTEKDVLRAVRYWKDCGLMSYRLLPDGTLDAVSFILPDEKASSAPAEEAVPIKSSAPAENPDPVNSPGPVNSSDPVNSPGLIKSPGLVNSPGPINSPGPEEGPPCQKSAMPAAQEEPSKPLALEVQPKPAISAPRLVLSPERLSELKEEAAVKEFLYMAEQYLAKPLTFTEIQTLIYFYDGLGMSAELIEYLIEYNVERGHKSLHYMEAVARSWTEQGITTPAMARESLSPYRKEYYIILKAMGLQSLSPIGRQITYMNTWLDEYGFDISMIQEACERTVLSTGQPSFPYANKILSDWRDAGLHTLSDVQKADDARQKTRQAEKSQAPSPSADRRRLNRFNNFRQRSYDYDDLEKQLLSSSPTEASTKEVSAKETSAKEPSPSV